MKHLSKFASIRHLAGAAALLLACAPEAAAQQQAAGESGFFSLIPLILIMVIFYFLLIRPQQKRVKEHKQMVEALQKGDRVVTAGGILGTITEVTDDVVKVEIADGVRVKVKRDTVLGRNGE